MNIAYIGRVTLPILSGRMTFDHPLLEVKWGFPLGTEIVCGLVARGHHVSVIASDNHVDETQVYHAPGCDVYIVPDRKRTRWQYLTLFAKEVHGIRVCLARIRPDVVFAQWTYHNAYAGLTSGFPTLVVAHDSPWRVVRCQFGFITVFKALYAQFLVFPKVRNLVAVSPHIVKELKRFRCLRYLDIPVIPNGISSVHSIKKPTHSHPPTIICVSEWGKLKNVRMLLLAFVALRKHHPDWRLLMVGSWLDKDRGAGQWMQENNLPICGIEFHGILPFHEVARMIEEEADLFVSPSLEESFGMVFVEAMRFGVPCIGGKESGAVPWVVGDGGVLCDVTKPDILSECIERVMKDEQLRKRLGECGKRRVREMFDINRTVELYEIELKKIIKGNGDAEPSLHRPE